MPTYPVQSIIEGQPTFDTPLDEILSQCKRGGAIKVLSPVEHITDRQRRWYKGVCLPFLAKNDENGEPAEWWDTEIKKECNGLSLLKKDVFMWESAPGHRIPIGRLTTKGVGKRNMMEFITMILSVSMEKGWDIPPPDPDLRR